MKKIFIATLCLGLVFLLGMVVFEDSYAASKPDQEVTIQQPIKNTENVTDNQNVITKETDSQNTNIDKQVTIQQPTKNSKNVANDKTVTVQQTTTSTVCPYNHENCNSTHQNETCQNNHENCDGSCQNNQKSHSRHNKKHSSSNGQHHRNTN